MMLARAYLETPAQKLARWSGSASMIAALHVTAGVLAFLFWPASPPEMQQPGAIMIELEAQAGEATHDLQEMPSSLSQRLRRRRLRPPKAKSRRRPRRLL